jgi:phytoene dehydrogenase-like protein
MLMALDANSGDADVVIIGGGHNGLVAGGYLSRAGRRVVLVEAADTLGGMTSSAALIPGAPGHTVHPCAVDVIFMRTNTIERDLDLHRHGYRTIETDAPYAYLHPDGTPLVIWRDPARTAEEIRRFCPSDADAYLEFTDLLSAFLAIAVPAMRSDITRPAPRELARIARAVVKNRKQLSGVVGLVTASALQAVDERFTHPVVRAALLGLAAGAGPVENDASAMSFLLLGLLHDYGVGRPVGGMQSLVDALTASFCSHGGQIRTGTPVSEIQVRGGRAVGVTLADGSSISARAVLSTADPHTTLRELLPDGTLDRQLTARVDHIPANADGASPFKVDLALSGHATVPNHRHPEVDLREPVLLYGTEQNIVDSFAAAARGEVCEDPFIWACITSAVDATQAPEGQDCVYLYPPAMPSRPPGGWEGMTSLAEKITTDTAGKILGRLDELEIGRWVESPDQMARRTRAWQGSILHVDFSLMRTGPLRPAWGLGSYRTPIDGLFLGGAGTHPGGSVSGLPGKLSSRRVERDLTKRR